MIGERISIEEELENSSSDKKKNPYSSKLDIVPEKDLEEIGRLIFSKQLTYKKATELILKNFPKIDSLTQQNLREFLIKRGYVPSSKSMESIYKRMSKREILKEKRTIIANIVLDEIIETRFEEITEKLLNNNNFLIRLKEKLNSI